MAFDKGERFLFPFFVKVSLKFFFVSMVFDAISFQCFNELASTLPQCRDELAAGWHHNIPKIVL